MLAMQTGCFLDDGGNSAMMDRGEQMSAQSENHDIVLPSQWLDKRHDSALPAGQSPGKQLRKRDTDSNIKSARRALALLELLENLKRPTRVSEVARFLRCPQSSASVLLNSLVRFGYLSFNKQTHEFAPSVRIALIGSNQLCDGIPATRLRCLLGAVRKLTGFTTSLVTRNGINAQYLYSLNGPDWVLTEFSPGTVRPLTHHASGIALLSDSNDSEIALVVRHLNSLHSGSDVARLDEVMALVQECRETGYSAMVTRPEEKSAALAIKLPIRDHFGAALVLAVSGPVEEFGMNGPALYLSVRDAIEEWRISSLQH